MNSALEAEKQAFDSLIEAGLFQRAPNLRKLLTFLWEQYLQGTTGQIKEYTLATEVLGRPATFDQKRDAIVRVEMHRLRKRLREYYADRGGADPIMMEIPEGSYVPVFVHRESGGSGPTLVAPDGVDEPRENPAPESVLEVVERMDAPKGRTAWPIAGISTLVVAAAIVAGVAISRDGGRAAAMPDGEFEVARGILQQPVRILAGQEGPPRVDLLGQSWSADRYFTGGSSRSGLQSRVVGASEPFLFEGRREGDFQYDIPLRSGYYELRLYFAETLYGDGNVAGMGETARLFSVYANGRPLLEALDLLGDMEAPNLACVKVFKDIQPAEDGLLHLAFKSSTNGQPVLNAIEIRPAPKGRMLPIRMVAHSRPMRDRSGRVWQPDHWVTGGVRVARPDRLSAMEPELYFGERYGHFTYRIPVAPGTYQLTVHMAEAWFGPNAEGGGGRRSRRFSLFCNHRPLFESMDLFDAAGGTGKPYQRTFAGLKPNAQGKLVLQFQPEVNYAMVNALEVIDVSPVQANSAP
jgi:hypothetical protein